MTLLWKNWFVHNVLSHPLMEVIYWVVRPFSVSAAEKAADAVHDVSVPNSGRRGE